MEPIIVDRSMNPAYRDLYTFTGEQLASVASTGLDRWTQLNLYQTQGGNYICQRVDYAGGKVDQCQAVGAEKPFQVLEFFGTATLAEQLYRQADILGGA